MSAETKNQDDLDWEPLRVRDYDPEGNPLHESIDVAVTGIMMGSIELSAGGHDPETIVRVLGATTVNYLRGEGILDRVS